MQFADKIHQGVHCLLDQGHTETAQWVLDKLLADYPDHARAHHDRAMLAHGQGDVQTAGRHFKQAAELAPDNPLFQKSLGDFFHVSEGRAEDAVAQYLRVLRLRPDDADTLLTTAHLYVSLHRFDEARDYYRKILRIDPGNAQARKMIEKLDDRKTRQEAQASPEVLYQAACWYLENERKEEAVGILEKILTIDAGHALAHNDLGVLYFEGGDLDKAQVHYEKAAEAAPENGVFQKNLGDFYYVERGEIQKALVRYVQALSLDPQDVEALMSTGHICMSLKQWEDARVFFDRVLEIEPWHNQASELLQQLESSISADRANNTPTRPDGYASAQERAAAGDAAGAMQLLEQVVAQDPNHAMAHNDLGVLYYERGDKENALRCYEKAARLDPANVTIMKNLADFYYVEQGRTEDALKIYIAVLKSDREDVECLIAAGAICMGLENKEDARTFYERAIEIEPWNSQAQEALIYLESRFDLEMGGTVVDFKREMAR